MREIITLALFTMVFAATAAAGPDSTNVDAHAQTVLSLRLSSQVLGADSDVTVLVTVEPDARNTTLVVEADGATFSSSEIPLEGASASRLHSLTIRRLASGRYDVTARLYSGGRLRATAHKQLIVGSEVANTWPTQY